MKGLAICFGAGRFLRAVLVPAFRHLDIDVIILQTRGEDFVNQCKSNGLKYEIDTVERDGNVSTEIVQVVDVASLGNHDQRHEIFQQLPHFTNLRYIGVGVTEAGIYRGSQSMKDLGEFLVSFSIHHSGNRISIINTDNLPANGDAIKSCILESIDITPSFVSYLDTQVTFHNTMVDRITAARPQNQLVPYAEPLPSKALVLEDIHGVLPELWAFCPGVVVRKTPSKKYQLTCLKRSLDALQQDHVLKISIANATHTAMVYCLALARIKNTTDTPEVIYKYLDGLYQRDIVPALQFQGISEDLVHSVYNDWIHRLRHQSFGMDTFFVAQNAWTKYNIRLFSNIAPLVAENPNYSPSAHFAFATASILRFLTPFEKKIEHTSRGTVFTGRLEEGSQGDSPAFEWSYASGLHANFATGIYSFRDGNDGEVPTALLSATKNDKAIDSGFVSSLLGQLEGFDDTNPRWQAFTSDVAALYNESLKAKPLLQMLEALVCEDSTALTSETAITECIAKAVEETWVIDVHTHLFPPTHSTLMLWGIDALLTYHYLVAEYLITAPMSPETFLALSIEMQANAIWKSLFVDRSPLSEACQGVVTTLNALGLKEHVAQRDLASIRGMFHRFHLLDVSPAWFAKQDPNEYVDLVFQVAKIRYVLMTNIPFDPTEAKYWLDETPYSSSQFKTALRIDQVLLGDWKSLGPALDTRSLPHTLDGIQEFLLHWIQILNPVYFMASVPASFILEDSVPPDASKLQPSGGMMLQHVLLPLADSKNLPIALKFGALRQMNPRLGIAGDGLAVTDVSILTRLALQNPKVKFLATFLSRVNQHEVTVVANKFRNIHLYGCWWYCNNPSIIQELTRMRLELLGTAFTSQHSDARVLDQLIYKWAHFRTLLREALVPLYSQLHRNGWTVRPIDIQRDVERLLGHSYEEFLIKSVYN